MLLCLGTIFELPFVRLTSDEPTYKVGLTLSKLICSLLFVLSSSRLLSNKVSVPMPWCCHLHTQFFHVVAIPKVAVTPPRSGEQYENHIKLNSVM